MTGRTNVGGGGVALNADVVPKIIKSGSITAGDFVQYYLEENTIDFQRQMLFFLGNIGQFVIAVLGTSSDNRLVLIKDGEVIDSYSTYNVKISCVYGNYIIINVSSTLIVLGIQNEQFVLVDSVQAATCIKILGINNKIIGLGSGKDIIICDISNIGELSNLVSQTISYMSYDFNANDDIRYYNGYYYIIKYQYQGHKFELDANNNITNSERTYDSTKGAYNYLNQYGNKVLYGGTTQLVIFEIVTGNKYTITLPSSRELASNLENELFIAKYSSSELALYKFDIQTETVTLLDINTSLTRSYYSNWLHNDTLYASIVNNGSKYSRLEIINESYLQLLSDKNYVVPFSQYGHPIGVAKDSGRTNDIIDVYVPTETS